MSAQPLSLYLDLEPGQVADLEVVASAALAWAAAIRETAYILDPSIEVRVELASGTAGSLSLNAILRSVRDTVTDKQTIRTIIITALVWAFQETASWTYGQILDALKGEDAAPVAAGLSDEDKEDIARRVAKALEGKVATSEIQRMYRALERDPAIKGVGATTTPGKRPAIIVPRQSFPQKAGHGEVKIETVTKRTVPQTLHVTLIRVVLVEDGGRRWRFKTGQTEFSANMKDQEFLQRLLTGATPVPMVTGIEMDIELETTEELRGGVWVATQRDVTHVVRLRPPIRQTGLPFTPSDEDKGDDASDDDDGGDGKP